MSEGQTEESRKKSLELQRNESYRRRDGSYDVYSPSGKYKIIIIFFVLS